MECEKGPCARATEDPVVPEEESSGGTTEPRQVMKMEIPISDTRCPGNLETPRPDPLELRDSLPLLTQPSPTLS
jgi:hypothetical protein